MSLPVHGNGWTSLRSVKFLPSFQLNAAKIPAKSTKNGSLREPAKKVWGPDVTTFAALRTDARYYLRQVSHRQPQHDIERKRRLALVGVAAALAMIAWLLFAPF